MKPSKWILRLVFPAMVTVAALYAQSALDQLKVYTETTPVPGKAAPGAPDTKGPAPAGLPDIVGVRIGMPVRQAYMVLQSAYPSKKLDTTSLRYPTIPQPVLDGFSFGFNPVPLPDERINVDITPPPNQQVVWRIQRLLPKLKIHRSSVIGSLREKYGKEALATNGPGMNGAFADDQHAAELWWYFDEQARPAKGPSESGYGPLQTCRLRFSNYSDQADAMSFSPGNRWFSTLTERSGQLLDSPDWCNTVGTIVTARFNAEEIITVLDVEMYSIPLATRSSKAQVEWLKNLEKIQRQQEIERSKQQAKPKL
jgi:hypothetical protein